MINLYTYRLPFKEPFQYASGKLSSREGIIITYKEDNITAFGEVAPLPGFSDESLLQAGELLLQHNKEDLHNALKHNSVDAFLGRHGQMHSLPSLAFAIDTLAHDLAAKRANKSLFEHLFPNQHPRQAESNAVIPIRNAGQAMADIKNSISEGFGTIKVKVGINFDEELKLLHRIRQQYPEITIRIDANEAWSVAEAIANLNSLEKLNIEYCEQPVARHNIIGLAEVKRNTSVLIAADEAAGGYKQALQLIEAKAADIIILKPALFGNYKNIFVTNALADTHGIAVIFTTMMEAAVSRSAIANLAAGLGSRNFGHGLSTGNLFSVDIAESSWLNKNPVRFPEGAGLGLQLTFKNLNVFRQ